jgi:3-methyl-2-oxobutanoate hydroxymethyltransferase
LEDAAAVERAGAFALVLEGIPSELAREITKRASIPTIGLVQASTATARCW